MLSLGLLTIGICFYNICSFFYEIIVFLVNYKTFLNSLVLQTLTAGFAMIGRVGKVRQIWNSYFIKFWRCLWRSSFVLLFFLFLCIIDMFIWQSNYAKFYYINLLLSGKCYKDTLNPIVFYAGIFLHSIKIASQATWDMVIWG